MDKKYEITAEAVEYFGRRLYRIVAVKDFNDVKKGDLGGYIESENNLSQDRECWVYENAKVSENAKISGDAKVSGKAEVYGDAKVYGNALVYGNAKIYGNAKVMSIQDYVVFKNNFTSGRYFTYTFSNKMWNVGCFYGNSEELLQKAKKESDIKYRGYKAYVDFVKILEELNNEKYDI